MFEHPLRLWRKSNGVTLIELAEIAETTPSSISRIETGKQQPSMPLLARLLKATKKQIQAEDFLTFGASHDHTSATFSP
jgi:transcriptional regulator with XRE-family HTH domain